MNSLPALRLHGFNKPTIWSNSTTLWNQTNSINLGQGFPSWSPPDFFIDNVTEVQKTVSHQYTRSFGAQPLLESISNFYKPIFSRNINPLENIVVAAGGVGCLNSTIQGLVNPGDHVVCMNPAYDAYAAQIQFAGGILKSVSIRPRKMQTKQDVLNRPIELRYHIEESDKWDLDLKELEQAINDKTKLVILNTPHNPTGKVFTQDELEGIAKIILKYPNCYVIEDGVYEHLVYGDRKPFQYPRIANIKDMWERTINIYSAGKLFCATGIRVGWSIAPLELTQCIKAFHQYNTFCMHGPMQEAVARCLQVSQTNGYFEKQQQKMIKNRNLLLDQLLESKYDFNIWIPESGYFILTDISRENIEEQYFKSDIFGDIESRDIAFMNQQAHKDKVIAIPCSYFYQDKSDLSAQNYVRYAFCKDEQIILDAGKNLK